MQHKIRYRKTGRAMQRVCICGRNLMLFGFTPDTPTQCYCKRLWLLSEDDPIRFIEVVEESDDAT